MRKEANFSASADIARRAGVIDTSYRTKDGRYIISEHALRSIRMQLTPDEFVNGLDVILLTDEEAKALIIEGGYKIGDESAEPNAAAQQEGQEENAEAVENEEETGNKEEEE